jgi:hypothetical protein
MISRENLEKKYISLETIGLPEIFSNKDDYTELAASVALAELKKRQVPEEQINSYKPVFTQKNEPEVLTNYLVDLELWEKVAFFIIWIPRLRSYFTYNFQSKGYILKSNQSNYYSISGFIFCMTAIVISNNFDYPFFAMWVIGLIISYMFDILYNKQRQIDGLQKKVSEGKVLKW